ncbi:MAG: hypothetical protein AABY22_09530 [Nanoarchaeota archaeon]
MAFGPIAISIFISILVIILVALGVYFLILYFRELEKPEDEPFLLNFMPSLSNGHSVGTVKNIEENQTFKRKRLYFEPKDIKPTDIWKKAWTMQDIIVETDKLLIFPKGTLSAHKSIIIAQSVKPEMMSDYFRDSSLGKALTSLNESKNADNVLLSAIREASNRKDYHVKEFAEGEVSENLIKFMDAFYKDRMKKMSSETAKDKISSISPYTKHET